MTLSDVVDAVARSILATARTELRDDTVVSPQVHLFTDDSDLPYAGCVVVREFQPGDDAAWAIRGLGYPPSALPASRVLIIWEQPDLLLDVGSSRPSGERALVFLDATTREYDVTWYPFTVSVSQNSPGEIRWAEPRTARRPALPGPIAEVLDTWLEFVPDDFADTIAELVRGGYRYFPVARHEENQAPDLDEVRAAVENVHYAVGTALASGEPAAVERACQLLRESLADLSQRDPLRGAYLIDLCLMLQLRYENGGDIEDVAESMRAARSAAQYPDLESPAKRLNALSTALRVWYEQTGERAALEEAIDIGRQAVDVLPRDDPNFGTCLANLAWALHASFLADGDPANLDAAVAAARRALDAFDVLDPRREVAAMALGTLLLSGYQRTGDRDLLDDAITLGRSALTGSTSLGWMLAARLSNLGNALETQYRRGGDLGVLREAVRATRRALMEAPPDHADRTIYQLSLSGKLRALFDRTDDPAVLHEAFTVARDAVDTVPANHPFRVNHLANLGVLHLTRYARTDALTELDAAVTLLRAALVDAGPTHPYRPVVSSALGEALHARSRRTAGLELLDEAMRCGRDALDSLAEDHPNRGTVLRTLAEMYRTRHERLGDRNDLAEAIALFQTAATHRTSPVRVRVDAARDWGVLAADAGRTEAALEGFATGVGLLPLLAARSLHRHDSEHWLGRYGGLASDAAALAMALDRPERALELLELGRTVLMAQALDIRTDLASLREQSPRLADRFEWIGARLEYDDDEQPDGRRVLADELDAVVAAARALPGMGRFLLPPTAAQLRAQADRGPVVLVNVSAYRSDALVLTAEGVCVRPLPELTPGAVAEHVERFLTALDTDCRSPFRQARLRGEQTLTDTLTWLWRTLGTPILDLVRAGRRMWWIPTGLLGFLPLHAATDGTTGESLLDHVVCSYTPSVRALAHARATAGSDPATGTLVVGMPQTPDAEDLPGVLHETALVVDRAPNARPLIGPDATGAAVADALAHSSWAHFACHATTDASPSNSRLLLHDHEQQHFTVAAVSRLRLDSAVLAYLSACNTAASRAHLADEVIHIASAFHLAGYTHVIGTLWAVDDNAAASIAELVYANLTADHPDAHRAPDALHEAVTGQRTSHPCQPSRWASHIHIGI